MVRGYRRHNVVAETRETWAGCKVCSGRSITSETSRLAKPGLAGC